MITYCQLVKLAIDETMLMKTSSMKSLPIISIFQKIKIIRGFLLFSLT